jgi:hypothetical protein
VEKGTFYFISAKVDLVLDKACLVSWRDEDPNCVGKFSRNAASHPSMLPQGGGWVTTTSETKSEIRISKSETLVSSPNQSSPQRREVRRGFVQDDLLIQSQWVGFPAACFGECAPLPKSVIPACF